MKKLGVCLLNDSFPPLIDGVSNAVVNYAGIIQKNYGTSFVGTPKYPKVKDDYPFDVIRYPSIDVTKLTGYRAGYPFSISAINKMTKHKFDIIHSHCPMASTYLARTLREYTDKPIVFTYHTKFDIDIKKAIDSPTLQNAAMKLIINNIEACDDVWVVSKGAGENLRSNGFRGSYTVMENGVDFPKGRVSAEKSAALLKEYGIPESMPVFLFVGRMMWYKGIKTSIDGLCIAKQKGEKFKMIFVGDGVDRKEIEEYSKKAGLYEDCIFAGAIGDREILRTYFCISDLFLFPSTFDTNGIVVREAAACSLASVIVKNSCAAEGLSDMENGLLIEDNAESMAEKIIFACHNRQAVRKIGENAADEIYISWDSAVKKACERYNAVIERHDRKKTIYNKKDAELFSFVADISEKMQSVHSTVDSLKNEIREKFKFM